ERIRAVKADRRIHLGPGLTFLFENSDTMLYQVQEMLRAESITADELIQHEIDTDNDLIGDRGELDCTLLIEIDDPSARDQALRRWHDLPETLYSETVGGRRIPARFDPRQVGEQRISSVHYLKFSLGDQIPAGIGSTHPEFDASVRLEPRQAAALAADLIA